MSQPSDAPTEPPSPSWFSSPYDDSVEPTSSDRPTDSERRRCRRLPLKLRGRYMLADGSEFSCDTLDVSPLGIAFRGRPTGAIGDRVVAYVDQLGRIEGTIVRLSFGWFAIEIAATPGKLERLARKIDSLVQRENDGALDRQPATSADWGPAGAVLQARRR